MKLYVKNGMLFFLQTLLLNGVEFASGLESQLLWINVFLFLEF